MKFQYFTVEFAVEVHDSIIQSTGGIIGVLNNHLLASSIVMIENDDYYPDLHDKMTHLFYSINKNHCFHDGNKRASIALCAYFLEINGLDILIPKFITEMENIAVDVADNRINKTLLAEIIMSLLYESEYSESLKLKIIDAKMKSETF